MHQLGVPDSDTPGLVKTGCLIALGVVATVGPLFVPVGFLIPVVIILATGAILTKFSQDAQKPVESCEPLIGIDHRPS